MELAITIVGASIIVYLYSKSGQDLGRYRRLVDHLDEFKRNLRLNEERLQKENEEGKRSLLEMEDQLKHLQKELEDQKREYEQKLELSSSAITALENQLKQPQTHRRRPSIDPNKDVSPSRRARRDSAQSSPFNSAAIRSTSSEQLRTLLDSQKYGSEVDSGFIEIGIQDIEYKKELGSGTSGTVYSGLYLNKQVALKTLKATSDKEVQEFIKEFHVLSRIKSPYFTEFYGAVIEPEIVMVMELCRRGSLFDLLQSQSVEWNWARTLQSMRDMTLGLATLHHWKPPILHRDIKSKNFVVSSDWTVKLCDFGLSRFDTDSNMDTKKKMKGTMVYTAPECYLGPFTVHSDVYSLGLVFWEISHRCVLGKYLQPFKEYKNLVMDYQVIVQVAKKGLRPTIRPEIPLKIRVLIENMWSQVPEERPAPYLVLHMLDAIAQDIKDHPHLYQSDILNQVIAPPSPNPTTIDVASTVPSVDIRSTTSSDVPSNDIPSDVVPSSDVPSNDAPSKDIPNDVPSNDVPSNDVPSNASTDVVTANVGDGIAIVDGSRTIIPASTLVDVVQQNAIEESKV
eukprot:TRINITY_DN6056_c0_g1_i4.p1 TRINITY_DN6056_c0_g1~~TRINITY_DN6056_c0_g1_i4.p1  ORF type:complete len:567 (+),score=148.63 TRINITY_DN6056_c0_g1_i4:38-1738(+)